MPRPIVHHLPSLCLLMLFGATAAAAQTAPRPTPPARETQFRIPVDTSSLRIFLRHLPPQGPGPSHHAPILFIHGASFPSALAAAYRFDGVSWMDDLSRRGFDVWALDFLGYGGSDRYPEMREAATAHPALGRAPMAARQIAAAVEFIASHQHVARVSLIAHSWGTVPAGLYAGDHPDRIDRLVQFGPVAERHDPPDSSVSPAYQFVTEEAQRSRFYGYVPAGEPPVLDPRHFGAWGPAYMATDSSSGTRSPVSVAIPSGAVEDFRVASSGHLPYDPSRIMAPVLIVRGEWEAVTRDEDARWLYDALTHAALKRDVKISRATHVMHLEAARGQLYDEVAAFLAPGDTSPRVLKVAAFGALTGPVHAFGINSRAALTAAAERINRAGGVRLRGGATARFEISYDDDHCDPKQAIALVHRYAAGDALVAVGPSCSSVAEPLYDILNDTLALPVFTDGATKADLARRSTWAFRNAPNERDMYRALWAWVRAHHPALATVYGGQEADFAHSHATWTGIISPEAEAAGLRVLGAADWSITDTAFTAQVARIAAARADIVVLSGHAGTTCGVLREMRRQALHPKLVVGLTSASSRETLTRCGADAEGLLVPTSFLPTTPAARAAAAAVERAGGTADLHSMAAWEILTALKQVIERAGVIGDATTRVADRRAIRDGLAALRTMDGLMGPIERTPDRESKKPFVLVQARHGAWQVVGP